MFYNVTQVTKYFKRCVLKKNRGKMIRGKQVTLHFSNVVVCTICEKKIIIKKLHFSTMFFFQCPIIILENV